MKKTTALLLSGLIAILLACQSLSPTLHAAGTPIPGETDTPAATPTIFSTETARAASACAETVAAMSSLRPAKIPDDLLKTGKKQADAFDVNRYFEVLPHLSMREDYTLDYVYQGDSLGAFPRLYARPVDQAPYASVQDIPSGTKLPDYHEYLEVDDLEQGYFEYVVMDIMAGQFYLSWHANYNDTRIVCNRPAVDEIIAGVNSGDFGNKLDLVQQTKARGIKGLEPVVTLVGDAATVQIVTFTKWGGFYRLTYTISRAFPHTIIDVEQEQLVPYDCGVMF